ncbi:hypothetical protein FA048_00540 [Pedobacter polaris]|uniref:Lipoprotein n=1 Tax=Pedobacter polaris TaxID=2571273 RepID=A0A4U1CSP8_9SPHI|nr:hypothetical protein [Pedobacter polaris]TKC12141.1 hypothetical protein FA048_00540 [Pedobacter polaris]
MKKIYFIIAMLALGLTFGCEIGASNQSISVKNTENSYTFKAEYPKHKTNEVVTYIEGSLEQDDFFSNVEGMKDEDVTLTDSTKFHITAEPGFIKINFTKRDNSATSYDKMVKLCQGIKEALK